MGVDMGTNQDMRMSSLVSYVLIAGVSIAALTVSVGIVLFLAHYGDMIPHFKTFSGEPADLRSFSGVVHELNSRPDLGIIQAGLFLLILTPIVRVALSIIMFVWEKDTKYVVVSSIVLGVLLCSLLSRAG